MTAHVFMHKPAKAVATSHLDRLTVTFGFDWRRTIRRDQIEAPVRSTTVAMLDEDLDDVSRCCVFASRRGAAIAATPDRRHQPTISTTPVATSYIAPAILMLPFFSNASRTGLRRRISPTTRTTFVRATAST